MHPDFSQNLAQHGVAEDSPLLTVLDSCSSLEQMSDMYLHYQLFRLDQMQKSGAVDGKKRPSNKDKYWVCRRARLDGLAKVRSVVCVCLTGTFILHVKRC